MIALPVLIFLLWSHAQSRDDELQGMYELNELIGKDTRMNYENADVAVATFYNKRSMSILNPSQKNVIWLQIACEARPQRHDEWKRGIKNHSAMIEKLAAKRQQKGIDCDNVTSTSLPSFQCLCDNSSHINFHWNLEAEFLTAKNRLEAEREMGEKVPCKDELWAKMNTISNGSFFAQTMSAGRVNREAEMYANHTNNKRLVTDDIKLKYGKTMDQLVGLCKYTPRLHRILSKLRHVDIRFRIYDDLLKMKFLSLVPFNFCNEDYLLSKCICDKRSSAAFCMPFFFKQSAILYVNETLCDSYSPVLTSAASTSSYYSITAILLLSSLRF
ncbi:hypothetical protein PRIPAC_93290 [Pristionchus pacificus]|uniref:Uncharacterized protein n=1 Tax=Pristionchus pacificus TaxID=54126 RepID=A0A2A6BQD3_PRIPA|nr:hypothetical protein PRIPAC_93290 [Pristionchus pacificus]|eukprot:PDM68120.1 hypothetical protein PRIPAC_46164 [Pristionchus pacificus]